MTVPLVHHHFVIESAQEIFHIKPLKCCIADILSHFSYGSIYFWKMGRNNHKLASISDTDTNVVFSPLYFICVPLFLCFWRFKFVFGLSVSVFSIKTNSLRSPQSVKYDLFYWGIIGTCLLKIAFKKLFFCIGIRL